MSVQILQLTCQGARTTAEPGIVLVPTIPGLHNQLAVGKVGVVLALLLHLNLFDGDDDTVLCLIVAITGAACVAAPILGLGLIDAQCVVVPLNFQSRAFPNLLSIFQPFHSWSQPRVDLAWNENTRVRLVFCLCHSDPDTNLAHSGSLGRSSDGSIVIPAPRSRRPINAWSRGGCWSSRCIWTSYHISHKLLLSRCRVDRAIHLHSDTVGCRRSSPVIGLTCVRTQVRQCNRSEAQGEFFLSVTVRGERQHGCSLPPSHCRLWETIRQTIQLGR